EQVGLQDNFFELGGHSLLAIQLMSRVHSAFQVKVSLRRFFDAPTLAGLAAMIAEEQGVARPPAPALLPAGRGRELPLSFSQQRLWFIDQLRPGGSNYNISMPLRVEGRLSPALLGRTLSEVVRRHEVLRTRFPSIEGRGVQVILAPRPVSLPRIDLVTLAAGEKDLELVRLARAAAERPFDLGRDGLLRLSLLRLGMTDHAVLLTLHHIVSDGWSTGILVREVKSLYEAFAAGRPSPLADLSIQYADFAVWQREWLTGEVLEGLVAYWRDQLAGAPGSLDLPADRARPAVPSNVGSSRPEGVTPFMTLLAGFQSLLGRSSGQVEVVVGIPSAGRNRLELEPLIGFFINTLAIRTKLEGLTFRGLLKQVRGTTLEAYVHEDLPFEKLVDELGVERRLSHTPLFQVTFALQNVPVEVLSLPGLELRPLRVSQRTAQFDLSLSLGESCEGFAGTVEYTPDLFDGSTIDRLIVHYERLLAEA